MSMGATPRFKSARLALLPNAHHLDVQNVDARVAGGNMTSQAASISVNLTVNTQEKHVQGLTNPPTSAPRAVVSPQQPPPTSAKQTTERERAVRSILAWNLRKFFSLLKGRLEVGLLPKSSNSKVIGDQVTAGTSDFTVATLGSPDDPSAITTRTSMSKGEAYVLSMLRSGKGLACWQPRPRHPIPHGLGVMPGDVGIFGVEEGFQKIFNMWDDEDSIRTTAATHFCDVPYEIPTKGTNIINEEEHTEGDTLVQGTTSKTFYDPDGHGVTGFEFRYLGPHAKGGVLAFTSATMTERLPASERSTIFRQITRHAELIYRHASTLCHIPDHEGLYIVTGCMKSDSWALAGFSDPMVSPDDVLKLIRRRNGVNQSQPGAGRRYVWTDKGTADGYSGASAESGLQNQCLFLKGFKLGFSQSFRSRVKSPGPSYAGGSGSKPRNPDSSGPPPNDGDNNGTGSASGGGKGMQFLSIFSRSRSNTGPGDSDFNLTSFPNGENSLRHHPCDTINEFLLEESGSEFALCHDEDWIPVLNAVYNKSHEGEANEETSSFRTSTGATPSDYVLIVDGVATLVPDGYGRRTTDNDSASEEDIHTEFTTPRPPGLVPLSGDGRIHASVVEGNILGGSTDDRNPLQTAPTGSLSPKTGSQQPTDSSQQYPSNVANAPHMAPVDPPPEYNPLVCPECAMRDQSMVDVDVTSPGSWDITSDADSEQLSGEAEQEEAGGVGPNGNRPVYRGVSLTEQNLAFWESINPRDLTFRMQRVVSYAYSQRSLLDEEALARARAVEDADQLDNLHVFDTTAEGKIRRAASVIGIMPTPVEETKVLRFKSPTPPTSPDPHNTHSKSQSESCEPDIFEDNTKLKHFNRRGESRKRKPSQSSLMGASIASVKSCRQFEAKLMGELGGPGAGWVC